MAINTIYKMCFNEDKGIECERCMLSFEKMHGDGETHPHCAALGSKPVCPEEGCRKDCPLIIIDERIEL